ncbi:MAG: SCO family protein [Reichenbachiella sp.]|uniref:SCO family protein n=1 Tax=Reichenbachiella sp. TaxID=2184521 RepID=UPI0032676A07
MKGKSNVKIMQLVFIRLKDFSNWSNDTINIIQDMKRKTSNNLLVLASLLILVNCQQKPKERMNPEIGLPFYSEVTYTPEWLDEDDENYADIHQIADFSFVNQMGQTVDNGTFNGKIYVANFFFTMCPGVCPKMEKNLSLVQETFAGDDEIGIISHTVMPWADSVQTLHAYAQRNDIDAEKWHLVTGDKKDIYNLARNSYFADEGFGKTVTADEDFLHTEKVILIDKKRRIRGVYNGTLPLEMKRMIEDIHTLKKE